MLTTDKKELLKYTTGKRLWQGIPSIAVTRNGRIFSTFYSGGTTEQLGNFVLLVKSDDDGKTFSEPVAVCFKDKQHRCFDPCIWIDPQGRLWLTWACMPNGGVFGAICGDPDSEEITFGKEFIVGHDVMMNKPTVLSTGEWLFPIAVWPKRLQSPNYCASDNEVGAYAYKTIDNGKSFEKMGGIETWQGFFDEHMLLEFNDGRLGNYIRTEYGIGVSYSYDRGRTWVPTIDSGLGGPNSRFHIRRLASGRILLINHYDFNGRNNLTALLSEDDGKTWKYKLLLDERDWVSYPDSQEAADGYIYITYDRRRGCGMGSLEATYKEPREILFAKITEEDIIAGKLVSPESKMKCIISKLGKYDNEEENPFEEKERYSDIELAKHLISEYPDKVIEKIFEYYPTNCLSMQKLANKKLDELISAHENEPENMEIVLEIISLLRSVNEEAFKENPLVDWVKEIINTSYATDISAKEIADKLGISLYYMTHLFKQFTGITITDYKNQLKLSMAKKMLISTEHSLTDIAQACGFCSSSYFSEVFMRYERVSPSDYRKYLKHNAGNRESCEVLENADEKSAILFNMLPHKKLLSGIKARDLVPNPDAAPAYEVSYPSKEFGFLHETAIIEYHGTLFAAWYNNAKCELTGRTPIRFTTSQDGGKTWAEPEIVADDPTGKILYCPPVFGIDDDKLYMFMNQMVSPDHMHSLDLYVYNEETKVFDQLWSRPIPFKLNTNVYKLANGKLMLPGRIAEMDSFPNTPAVLISDSGKIDAQWRLVKIQEDGNLPDGAKFVHPELSAIVMGERVYIFSRNDERRVPIMYISEDSGETWSGAHSIDIPLAGTKIYSGTLSDGRNYIIGNIHPGRSKLAIFFSKPGSMKFTKGIVLQDGFSEEFGYGTSWHYPVAHEADGKLYVIYTSCISENWIDRGAALSVIDIEKI